VVSGNASNHDHHIVQMFINSSFKNPFLCLIFALVVNVEAKCNTLEHPVGGVDSGSKIRLENEADSHGIPTGLGHIHGCAKCVC